MSAESTFPERLRWWWHRHRSAYKRPLYTMDTNLRYPPDNRPCYPADTHNWYIEDRTPKRVKPDQWHRMVVCRTCRFTRCGHSDDANPCIKARHHYDPHWYADGSVRRVGA